MRHRDSGRKFGRKSGPRRALERDLVRSLFTHGRIETTLARAKEYRSSAEKLITLARRGIAAKERGDAAGWLHAFRRARAELGGTRSAETVTRRLFDEIAPQFRDRAGGYTRVIRHWRGRLGDNAPRALFELVGWTKAAAEPPAAGGAAGSPEAPDAKGGKTGRAAAAGKAGAAAKKAGPGAKGA